MVSLSSRTRRRSTSRLLSAGLGAAALAGLLLASATPAAPNAPAALPDATGAPSLPPLAAPRRQSPPLTAIHLIQGRSHRSPLEGRRVTVRGVVTGQGGTEFVIQSVPGDEDDDPATSEGLVVALAGSGALRSGDLLTVSGTVSEDRPGGRASNLTVTRLLAEGAPTIEEHQATLPTPVLLGREGRSPPRDIIDDDSKGDVESGAGEFDPRSDALDFFESLESMRVQVPRPRAVSPTSQYGELVVLADDGEGNPSLNADGLLVISRGDANPERLIIDDQWQELPEVSAGARFDGPLIGVLAYAWGSYRIWLSEPCPAAHGGLQPEKAEPTEDDALRIVNYNVENLSPRSDPSRIATLGRHIVQALGSPDLLALQEIQDSSGPDQDGVVSAAETFAVLQQAIDAAGGPSYQALEIAPVDGAEGGQPGGNIRVAYLLRSDSALELVSRPGGSATRSTTVLSDGSGAPRLSCSPGRWACGDPAWRHSRVPLALELSWHGRTLFVINNHWNSKGGDDGLFGPHQPPVLHSERQRLAQATAVRRFAAEILERDPDALVIALGDFNDFGFSAPLKRLAEGGLLDDQLALLPKLERWSYVYQGNAQALDHLLLSRGFSSSGARVSCAPLHLNAAFPHQTSDHDPLLLTLGWPEGR